jgi:hypothetical protein
VAAHCAAIFLVGATKRRTMKTSTTRYFSKTPKNARNVNEIRLTSIIENCSFPIHHRGDRKSI